MFLGSLKCDLSAFWEICDIRIYIQQKRLMVSNFEILGIVASFGAIDWHNRRMLIFLITLTIAIISFHKYIMSTVNKYDSYGTSTAKQEWVNFERERLSR
jgi:hypothetical protein